MKTATLSIAGKTFLAGEYLAIRGGPALVLATDPRFQMKIKEAKAGKNPFHPDSPAGRFFNENKESFSNFEIEFQDPYQGFGGFGASSAQFALIHALKQWGVEAFGESERFIDWHEILNDYRKLPHEGPNSPSGADIVGAVSGAVTWFDRNHGKVQTFAWPFQEYDFALYHTGNKLKTHEHLKSLGEFSDQEMAKAMELIHEGLKNVNFETFVEGLKKFQAELWAQGFVAEHTKTSLQSLAKNSDVLFAKGCGAMGSDVIFVLMKAGIAAPSEILSMKKVAGAKDISPGIKVHP